jgi:DNA-binding response OmpR family regulator
MRNKILVVDADQEERGQLELILQEIVDAGGELFFADTREDGLAILKKEHPQLIFVDAILAGEESAWVQPQVHVIFLCGKREQQPKQGDFILKPIKRHPILEKCNAVLSKEPVSPIPPM